MKNQETQVENVRVKIPGWNMLGCLSCRILQREVHRARKENRNRKRNKENHRRKSNQQKDNKEGGIGKSANSRNYGGSERTRRERTCSDGAESEDDESERVNSDGAESEDNEGKDDEIESNKGERTRNKSTESGSAEVGGA